MTQPKAIEVEHVSKSFRLHRSGVRTLKSAALDWLRFGIRGEKREFLALKDVNLSVARGEVLGIIGANGAGKSTLLALLAGTMVPSSGRIRTEGKISCLLELGAGFHPDLTGRENVYLAGAIMGVPRRVMKDRFDAVVEFAELASFIDQPVKHYSSGMYVRLGFAVAVEVDPDILLVDEVLAVGDASFRRKCIQRMDDFKRQGKTMLLISHDLHTVQSISDRIVLLDEGRIIGEGNPAEVIGQYDVHSRQKKTAGTRSREWGSKEAVIAGVEFLNGRGEKTDRVRWGDSLKVRLRYQASVRIENPVFGFAVTNENGILINGNNTQIENVTIPFIEGEGTMSLVLDHLTMAKGVYLFSFSLHSADHTVNYHRMDNCASIFVDAEKACEGPLYIPCRWIPGG